MSVVDGLDHIDVALFPGPVLVAQNTIHVLEAHVLAVCVFHGNDLMHLHFDDVFLLELLQMMWVLSAMTVEQAIYCMMLWLAVNEAGAEDLMMMAFVGYLLTMEAR